MIKDKAEKIMQKINITSIFQYIALLLLIGNMSYTAQLHASTSPKIVATTKPLHSIASIVLDGIAKPTLLVSGEVDPHHFHLRPSHMKLLKNADIVVFLGGDLESYIPDALDAIKLDSSKQLEMISLEKMIQLPYRKEASNHKTHEDSHHGHGHHGHGHHGHGHHSDKNSKQSNIDPHFWLNTENARTMAQAMAQKFSDMLPEHRKKIEDNINLFYKEINKLDEEIKLKLQEVAGSPTGYITYHDAYYYFEEQFSIQGYSGSIVSAATHTTSAKRVRNLQEKIKEGTVQCILVEKAGYKKIANLFPEQENLRHVTIDPAGISLSEGKSLYYKLIEQMRDGFINCLQ